MTTSSISPNWRWRSGFPDRDRHAAQRGDRADHRSRHVALETARVAGARWSPSSSTPAATPTSSMRCLRATRRPSARRRPTSPTRAGCRQLLRSAARAARRADPSASNSPRPVDCQRLQPDQPRQITRDSPVYRRHGWLPTTTPSSTVLRLAPPSARSAHLPAAPAGSRRAVSVRRDGHDSVFESTPGYSVWRVGLDRIEAVRLTGGHINSYPVCSADGQSVLYTSVRPHFPSIWRVAIGGGEPTQLIPQRALEALPSPTGRLLLLLRRRGGCTVRSLEPVQVDRREFARGRPPCVHPGRP